MEIFNLIDSPWIPVLFSNGEWRRIGLKELFERAKEIRTVAPWNPQDEASLLRLLIAIIYWTRGNFSEEKRRDDFQDVVEKLECHRDCFNLLGEGRRFYQVEMKDDTHSSVSRLFTELPSGTNIAHFYHLTDTEAQLCLPCCALGLVRWASWCRQGGRGYITGPFKDDFSYVFQSDKTLYDTLTKLWTEVRCEIGSPSWYGEPPSGLLKIFTFLPRKIRFSEPVSKGRCSYCGERDKSVINKIIFIPAERVDFSDLIEHEKFYLNKVGPNPNEFNQKFWLDNLLSALERLDERIETLEFIIISTSGNRAIIYDALEQRFISPIQIKDRNVFNEEIGHLKKISGHLDKKQEIIDIYKKRLGKKSDIERKDRGGQQLKYPHNVLGRVSFPIYEMLKDSVREYFYHLYTGEVYNFKGEADEKIRLLCKLFAQIIFPSPFFILRYEFQSELESLI